VGASAWDRHYNMTTPRKKPGAPLDPEYRAQLRSLVTRVGWRKSFVVLGVGEGTIRRALDGRARIRIASARAIRLALRLVAAQQEPRP